MSFRVVDHTLNFLLKCVKVKINSPSWYWTRGRSSGQRNPLRLISSSFSLYGSYFFYPWDPESQSKKSLLISHLMNLLLNNPSVFFPSLLQTTKKQGWLIQDLMTKSLKDLEFVLSRSLKHLIQNKGSQTRRKKWSIMPLGIILIGFKQKKINVQFWSIDHHIMLDE